jgi:hypothetical protein
MIPEASTSDVEALQTEVDALKRWKPRPPLKAKLKAEMAKG